NGITRLGPVLICHGLIGRQTMTDLLPERSIVRQLLAAGCDVYVLDWGDAGPNEADLGTTTITQSVLPGALDQVLAASGADRAVLMGICQGGTLAAIHAALDPSRLAGLITAVAPFDFTADEHDSDPAHGLLHLWTRAPAEADLSAVLEASGNLPGDLMGLIFDQLNPAGTLAKYAVKLTESGDNPEELRLFLAMEAWLADRPDLPATLAKEWLIGLYRQNQLADGAVKVGGKTVDLSELQLPVLNIMAANDHIVPPPCSRALRRLAPAAQYQELTVPAGHIGAFVSSRAQAVMGPEIIGWLRELRNQRFTTR
ncbi:MAG: alpha/beta fold hydrolase, partial [Pseudomonadota bacterium]